MKLSPAFLDDYKKHSPFKTLLQQAIYVGKYQRKTDVGWWDTVRRVVEGNTAHDPNVTAAEAEYLYDTVFNGICSPAGRGLYTCGVNMPSDAHYNCAVIPINDMNSWSWVLQHSMLGVGVGTTYHEIDKLPIVELRDSRLFVHSRKDHPDYHEVTEWDLDVPCATNYVVEDSREGWCKALYYAIEGAFSGRSVNLDVSRIRQRGAPLSTFDGTCSGYAPLVSLLRQAHALIRRRAGNRLRIIDAADLTNLTGVAAVMGNIRRTALNNQAPWDEEFLNAKIDLSAEQSFRYTSNNSIAIYTKEQEQFVVDNAKELANRVINLGEPGFANIYRCRLDKDPAVIGLNPCFEATLEPYEFCCLSEIVLPNLVKSWDPAKRIRAITRFTLRERMNPHACKRAEEVRQRNMRIGIGLTGIADVKLSPSMLATLYEIERGEADKYALELGVRSPIKVSVVKPSGTIAKLFNVSPGMNDSWSEHHIQRMRLGVNETLAYQLAEAKVPFEFAKSDSTNQTLVFELPVHRKSATYAVTNSARNQLERQLLLQQYYADQAVSATISFNKETDDLEALIKKYVPLLKSSCFFPNDGGKYEQAPMEQISANEYESRFAAINHDYVLARGEIEVDECKSGACPVR